MILRTRLGSRGGAPLTRARLSFVRTDWRSRAITKRVAVACVAVVTVLALLVSLAQSERRYFYCKAMGALSADPCMASAARILRRADEVQQTHTDCCAIVIMPAAQQGALTRFEGIADARLVAVTPASTYADHDLTVARRHSAVMADHVRWRPPPKRSGRLHTHLMVLLT